MSDWRTENLFGVEREEVNWDLQGAPLTWDPEQNPLKDVPPQNNLLVLTHQ